MVNATVAFLDKWFPHASPGIPDVLSCTIVNDLFPWTHGVTTAEERTAFGLSSANYSGDLFKIYNEKIPVPFLGGGRAFSFVLPFLSHDGTEAWTTGPRFHPNDKDRSNWAAFCIWNKDFFTAEEAWNIGRWPDSKFPPKAIEGSNVFRDGGRRAGVIRDPRVINSEKSRQDTNPDPAAKAKEPVLKPMVKEFWPEKLNTGRKYRIACQATRSSLPAWVQMIKDDPSLLDGPSDWEEDKTVRRTTQNLAEAVVKEKARLFGSSSPDPERSDQRSRSPCAVGPAVARAAVQDLSAADSSTRAQHYKLSESSSKGSALSLEP